MSSLLHDPARLAQATNEAASRGIVQHGSGNSATDASIATGYLYVNSGRLPEAVAVFEALLKRNPKLLAAFLGRGTAFALLGRLREAIADFSSAIAIDTTCADAWKRRGQARAAHGYNNDAIFDLSKATMLQPDQEVFHQRGLVFYKQKNYLRALSDFRRAVEIEPNAALSWNHAGLCLNAVGRAQEAIDAHKRAMQINPQFKESLVNMGQAYKELGMGDEALARFKEAIRRNDGYAHAHHLCGMCHHARGEHRLGLGYFRRAFQLDPKSVDSLHYLGLSQHTLGLFSDAIQSYGLCVEIKSDHVAWYNRQIAIFVESWSDKPWRTYNMDRVLDPYFKEAWCKRLHPNTLSSYKELQPPSTCKDVSPNPSLSAEAVRLVEEADRIGRSLQNNCRGYMPNKRQHRMCGFAVIEMAQKLHRIWRGGGSRTVPSGTASGTSEEHEFGWRDAYDICVRWRQLSEPNDSVWWVDLLSPEQFEEGFGSHTPMITGQTHVIRYYPMFERSFEIMKGLIREQCGVKQSTLLSVEAASDCSEMYEAMRKDFYIVTPCYSTKTGQALEGTRITLQYAAPEGYEFSIRTPGTPARWLDYDEEMSFVWEKLTTAATKEEPDMEECSKWILTLAFYWYNFMPLSRGSAACGYIGILAMYLALGKWMSSPLQKGQQVDWEGILTPRADEFIKKLGWMVAALESSSLVSELPNVEEVASTAREAIEMLNHKL
eukprot:TRINITY_DN25658_c0_g1_i1.p1 TRINITY_DN25658_c0_g1~~TRINITY_DN25658_c0_g1_i1.p1  ORF type:complete len:815 (-),score=165.27 TRINITY_DN25658_c0_g1_i1:123-2273(-)